MNHRYARHGGGHSHKQATSTKDQMDHKEDTTTTRLTTEIIRCIAMVLLDKAEELERFQRMEDETAPSEHPLSSDDALCL
jgi:hypothetical protein